MCILPNYIMLKVFLIYIIDIELCASFYLLLVVIFIFSSSQLMVFFKEWILYVQINLSPCSLFRYYLSFYYQHFFQCKISAGAGTTGYSTHQQLIWIPYVTSYTSKCINILNMRGIAIIVSDRNCSCQSLWLCIWQCILRYEPKVWVTKK